MTFICVDPEGEWIRDMRSHYEVSPREREDEAERDRRDFDTDNEDGEDERRDPQPRLEE